MKLGGHIIFDLDGTIIDSKEEILQTYQLVFKKLPPEVAPDYSKINYGATLIHVLSEIYDRDQSRIAEAKSIFSSIYDSSDYNHTLLYKGVEETLAILKSKEHELYIATNKRLKPTQRILERKNILSHFSGIVTSDFQQDVTWSKSDMIQALKDKFNFSSGLMVGDSQSDIKAGDERGLKTIAVTYGYENRSIFTAPKPTFFIDSFREILEIAQNPENL